MTRRAVSTAGAPPAVGPYSQAIVTDDFVFCSGQVGLDPATGELVEGGVEAQAERVLRNLDAVLDAAGCTFADVVKTTCFLADIGDFAAVQRGLCPVHVRTRRRRARRSPWRRCRRARASRSRRSPFVRAADASHPLPSQV